MRQVRRKGSLYLFFKRSVDNVALRYRQQAFLYQQFGIVEFQFVKERLVSCLDVVFLDGDHEQQHRIALDVAKEPVAYSPALVGSLYDSGDVRHDERLVVVVTHYAQVGFQGGECVVRYLGFGRRNHRKQRGFAGIGQAYEADVCKKLEFEDEPSFLSFFARLGETWGS